VQVFVHRIRKYLGAYLLQLAGSCHAIVFSAGVGENSPQVRAEVCKNLESWGIEIDKAANEAAIGTAATISTPQSTVKVLVLPTDEELCIAQDAAKLAGLVKL
jgi:acetate kinase